MEHRIVLLNTERQSQPDIKYDVAMAESSPTSTTGIRPAPFRMPSRSERRLYRALRRLRCGEFGRDDFDQELEDLGFFGRVAPRRIFGADADNFVAYQKKAGNGTIWINMPESQPPPVRTEAPTQIDTAWVEDLLEGAWLHSRNKSEQLRRHGGRAGERIAELGQQRRETLDRLLRQDLHRNVASRAGTARPPVAEPWRRANTEVLGASRHAQQTRSLPTGCSTPIEDTEARRRRNEYHKARYRPAAEESGPDQPPVGSDA